MDINRFWEIVETARSRTGLPFGRALVEGLGELSPQEILSWQGHFDEAANALHRWDVWGAAHLIGEGCSDDAFIDFRAGVIALGREWFQRVLRCPDELAEHPLVPDQRVLRCPDELAEHPLVPDQADELFAEELSYLAMTAYEQVTGRTDRFHTEWNSLRPAPSGAQCPNRGEELDFGDQAGMRARYPRLTALCPAPAAS